MRVFFNSQEIIEGPSSAVKRAIRRRKKDDPHLKYQFSGPFSEAECALYDLRSNNLTWFWNSYDSETIQRALSIASGRAYT